MTPITLLFIVISVLSVKTQDVVYTDRLHELRGVIVLCSEDISYVSYRTDPHLAWIEEQRQAQLTIEGRQSHFQIGQWLRQRYGGFLSREFNGEEIYVRSADVDRSVISSQAVVTGLYHLTDFRLSSKPIHSYLQSVPVERVSYIEDSTLMQPRTCPRHNLLFNQLHDTIAFRRVLEEYQEIIDHISYHTQEPITCLQDLSRLHNVLYVQESHNLPLPTWAIRVYPQPLRQFGNWYHALHTYTPELARLRTGRLLHDVVDHFDQITVRVDVPRLALYSGVNLVHVLNTLGVNQEVLPGQGQLVFELWDNYLDTYVSTYYRTGSDLIPLNLRNPFGNRCSLHDFRTLINPIRIDEDSWIKECNRLL